jgi:predicted enzyme related to lactoylglutathione lyase
MHAVVHVEIPVTNMRRAKEWYGKIFGWTFQDFDKSYTLWNAPGGGTGGGLYLTKKVPARAAARVYVEVEDVEATLKAIKKARGAILKGKTEVPSFGWWASFREPQGAELYLWQAAPGSGPSR